MKKMFLFCFMLFVLISVRGQKTEIQYLSGTDKDNTVMWDFFCTKGLNSGKWSKIAVPSNWELQGFGTFTYGHEDIPDEQGLYKYEFNIIPSIKNKRIYIVFEGSMTDTEVRINGISAGAVHQGSFYRFKYDITSLVKPAAKNLLEVTVKKESENESVNRAERHADYWIFGGIFRPVYLEIVPVEFIDHIAIDAKSNGQIFIDLVLNKNSKSKQVEAQVQTLSGKSVGEPFSIPVEKGQIQVTLTGSLSKPLLWNPEFPNLYQVQISLKESSVIKHQVVQRFGFRSVEVKQNDGIYINGTRIMFRGICRHSAWPTSGRCTSKNLSITDVNLIKDMNINAVRMSHYPPDQHFLDICDSLGLFVLDELAGWHGYYDTETGRKLVKEMVERDVNHPSIVLWDNGNEGGFNPELRSEFAKYDPQKRLVIEPQSLLNGMNTMHYIQYNYGTNTFFNGRDIFFPTEFLHGLFDGGHGAGLDDYWNLMLSNPLSAGGFLWVFADEGIVRNDKKDSIDTKGKKAPDGIVGPFREKEGSFYTIKEIWSPVFFEKKIITPKFDGRLRIENRFFFTNLNQCRFSYDLVKFSNSFPLSETARLSIQIPSPDINPGDKGWLYLKLPEDWKEYDAILLTANDTYGRHINTWSWNITTSYAMAERIIKDGTDKVYGREENDYVIVSSGSTFVKFNKKNGLLAEVQKGESSIPFNNGPVFVGSVPVVSEVRHYVSGENYVVEVIYEKKSECHLKWIMHPGGWLQLDYDYKPEALTDMSGITFSYPEENVRGASLVANGPYRVWKNRLKGTQFGIYNKKYNNTVTGESWDYPEFKGYYANFYAVQVQTNTLPFTIVCAADDLYLHLLTPQNPKFASGSVTPPFPSGNISIMHVISPIGTKFSTPEKMGPQSLKSIYINNSRSEPFKGKLFFKFGE